MKILVKIRRNSTRFLQSTSIFTIILKLFSHIPKKDKKRRTNCKLVLLISFVMCNELNILDFFFASNNLSILSTLFVHLSTVFFWITTGFQMHQKNTFIVHELISPFWKMHRNDCKQGIVVNVVNGKCTAIHWCRVSGFSWNRMMIKWFSTMHLKQIACMDFTKKSVLRDDHWTDFFSLSLPLRANTSFVGYDEIVCVCVSHILVSYSYYYFSSSLFVALFKRCWIIIKMRSMVSKLNN